MKRIFAPILVWLLASTAGCGGPLPPPDPPNLAEAKESLSRGNYWYGRGCYKEAERFFQGGLESGRLSDDVLLMIRAQNSLGAAALGQGDYPAAAHYLEQALNIATGHPGQPELDKVFGNLGSLAFKLGRNQDAEDFWKAAVALAEKAQSSAAPYYCNLARLYLKTGRTQEFSEMSLQALTAARLLDDQATLADALNLAGHQAEADGQAALAEERYLEALELDRKIENTSGLAQDTEDLGRLLSSLKRYQEASGYLDRAFFLWLALGEDARAGQVLESLRIMSREHHFPKSLAAYQAARRDPSAYRLAKQCP